MIVKNIIKYIENSFPKEIAWDKDNVGLQIGNFQSRIKNIFLTLELDQMSLDRALDKNCNFIFTHHPLIFKPINKINLTSNPLSLLIEKIIKNDITVYSAHTNFDFSKNGVSFKLAEKLKLKNIRFLENTESDQYKLTVYVPKEYESKVADSIFAAGGGIIGEYSNCSFKLEGQGSFKGSSESNPHIGSKDNYEIVEEVRLEILVNRWNLDGAISAMKNVHPYDEPAFDVFKLNNKNVNFGYGAIGELERPVSSGKFLIHVASSLKIKNFRYCSGKKGNIKKVAVCGGSCADLLKSAVSKGADAFVTADIKYHAFQEAENNILFIDAGHYETEIHSLIVIKKLLSEALKLDDKDVKVFVDSGSTNPVKYYKN